jgi:hypothetical protein
MSREQFAPKQTYTGTGSLDEYTFDFKITDLSQLEIVEVDDNGAETQRVRGDDNTYLSGVVFDAIEGGGTVTLAADLPANYKLILLLADDAPTQPYKFRNKTSFTLRRFEDALDNILGAVQRLAYKTKQSLRLHDLDDASAINLQLPPDFAANAGRTFCVNVAGDGLDYGASTADIANAQGYAAAAAQSAADALAAAGSLLVSSFVEYLGFTGICTVTPAGANIEGVASKALPTSVNASYKFRYTGTEWIIT